MKIRNGFVSNSSSSSFYIKQADRHLTLEEIPGYYNINPELSEEERVWLTLLIWKILYDQEKYDSNTARDWDYLFCLMYELHTLIAKFLSLYSSSIDDSRIEHQDAFAWSY